MIITLTTDFGTDSVYVAEMKGVILSLEPNARVVDITHAIGPQDLVGGALALEATRTFPPGSSHVAVVDPGVGTDRPLVAAIIEGRTYVAPDNGLLARVAALGSVERIVELRNDRYFAPRVSRTFHGRDILAPVAVHLARGVPLDEIGPPRFHLAPLDLPTVRHDGDALVGEVVLVDSFGNLLTNIHDNELAGLPLPWHVTIQVGRKKPRPVPIVATYGDAGASEVVALIGSSGRLEVAVVGGHAGDTLRAGRGTVVSVRTGSV